MQRIVKLKENGYADKDSFEYVLDVLEVAGDFTANTIPLFYVFKNLLDNVFFYLHLLKNTTIAQRAAFMKEIIVIYGDSNVGKTTVINEIYDDLVKNGASIKNAKSQQGGNPKDFDAELNYNGKNIALMSMGDIVGRVTDIVLKYKLSDVLITAYNTRHATFSHEWLKNAQKITVVRKSAATNSDNSSVLQQVIALI